MHLPSVIRFCMTVARHDVSLLSSAPEVASADEEEMDEEDGEEVEEVGGSGGREEVQVEDEEDEEDGEDECPYELKKDGTVLAKLYGASQLGEFTAYYRMDVTHEGARQGLVSLRTRTMVYAPCASRAFQMPPKSAMLYRVLIGKTKAASKKTAVTQERLLLLCLSETRSRFVYKARATIHGKRKWIAYSDAEEVYCDLLETARYGGTPLTMNNFEWLFSLPYHTPIDEHASSFKVDTQNLLELADSSIQAFAIPKVGTAHSRAGRNVIDEGIIRAQHDLIIGRWSRKCDV